MTIIRGFAVQKGVFYFYVRFNIKQCDVTNFEFIFLEIFLTFLKDTFKNRQENNVKWVKGAYSIWLFESWRRGKL